MRWSDGVFTQSCVWFEWVCCCCFIHSGADWWQNVIEVEWLIVWFYKYLRSRTKHRIRRQASHPFGIGVVVCSFDQSPTKAAGWELFHYTECSWLHFSPALSEVSKWSRYTGYSSPHSHHQALLQVSVKPVGEAKNINKIWNKSSSDLQMYLNFLSAQVSCDTIETSIPQSSLDWTQSVINI